MPERARRARRAAQLDALRADRSRAREPRRARAVLGRAARVPRDPRRRVDRDPLAPCSVHLSESAEEVEFIRSGGGPVAGVARGARRVGSGVGRARRAARCSTSTTAAFSMPRVLAVHGVQMSRRRSGAARARAARRSSPARAATATPAPARRRSRTSTPRACASPSGTDSLASAPDLNVFAELATMRALAPSVPASALLDSATRQGARALGFDADYGTIEPGKRARLLAVDDPARRGRCGRIPGVGGPAGADRGGSSCNAIAIASSTISANRMTELHVDDVSHLPLVRALQPLGVRAAVCAGRRAAGGARSRR